MTAMGGRPANNVHEAEAFSFQQRRFGGSRSATLLAALALGTIAGCSAAVDEDPATAQGDLDGFSIPKDPNGLATIERPPSDIIYTRFPKPNPEEFVEISAGGHHTCVRKRNGNVYCWGRNDSGQVGTSLSRTCGGYACVDRPKLVTDGVTLTAAMQVEAGFDHTCALTTAGAAFCWGAGGNGQIGIAPGVYGNMGSPYPVYGGRTYNSISAGTYSTCATASTDMFCWGAIGSGGGAAGSGTNVPTWVFGSTGVAATNVSTGYLHACAQWVNGSYRETNCWGANRFGQSGADPAVYPNAPLGAGPNLGTSALKVATQYYFTCADQPGPTVQCFGENYYGQLGNGTTTASPTFQPQTVGNGRALRGVTTGLSHACALDPNGAAYCWGRGTWGQLGQGVPQSGPSPVAVAGGLTFRAIAAGYLHTCGIATDNHIYCWGSNSYGQIGNQYPGSWWSSPTQALDP